LEAWYDISDIQNEAYTTLLLLFDNCSTTTPRLLFVAAVVATPAPFLEQQKQNPNIRSNVVTTWAASLTTKG